MEGVGGGEEGYPHFASLWRGYIVTHNTCLVGRSIVPAGVGGVSSVPRQGVDGKIRLHVALHALSWKAFFVGREGASVCDHGFNPFQGV